MPHYPLLRDISLSIIHYTSHLLTIYLRDVVSVFSKSAGGSEIRHCYKDNKVIESDIVTKKQTLLLSSPKPSRVKSDKTIVHCRR